MANIPNLSHHLRTHTARRTLLNLATKRRSSTYTDMIHGEMQDSCSSPRSKRTGLFVAFRMRILPLRWAHRAPGQSPFLGLQRAQTLEQQKKSAKLLNGQPLRCASGRIVRQMKKVPHTTFLKNKNSIQIYRFFLDF